MTSNDCIGNLECKNMTPSAASINRFCPTGMDKSMNGHSAACSPSRNEFSTEEGNKYSLKHSTEAALLTVNFSVSSAPSKASSSRDEQTSDKGLASDCTPFESSVTKHTGSNILSHAFREKWCVPPDARFPDESPSAVDFLKSSDGNKHLNHSSPTKSMGRVQDLRLQNKTRIVNDGTDDLVDVRVCDICGDAGREALLALCSKCTDGAEHIYCMRIMMDTVPGGDWMCEDCMSMQEPKRDKQAEGERSKHHSKTPYLKEVSEVLVKKSYGIQQADETMTKHSGKASCLSGKRPGFDIEVGRVPKRRILEGSVQPLKLSRCKEKPLASQVSSVKLMNKEKYEAHCVSSLSSQSAKNVTEQGCSPPGHRSPKLWSDREVKRAPKSVSAEKNVQSPKEPGPRGKKLLTRASSLKIVDKSKEAAGRITSFSHQSANKVEKQRNSPGGGHGSPKVQQKFTRGKLCKSKSINIPDSSKVVRWRSQDIQLDESTQESAGSLLNKKCTQRKLLKSMSFSGVNSVPCNASNTHFSHIKQHLRCGSGRNPIEKYGSARDRSPRVGSTFAGHDDMKADTHRTKVVSNNSPSSLRNNVLEMKVIQANGNSNVKPREPAARHGQGYANMSVARSIGETVSPSLSVGGIKPLVENVSCYPEQKAGLSTQKPEFKCSLVPDKGHLVASNKVAPINLHPLSEVDKLTPEVVVSSGVSAVPEPEFVWKGAFKLEKSCKLPNYCSGIQAHLSTCASLKAADLVHKFCPKILLKEVPRLNTWPIQFQRKLPTEHDIAIYFFAKDLESYSRSYTMVLEGMIKNDLALEADFNGVQLLIFPSSLLPVESQRWNALYFLWGVFRVRRADNFILNTPSLNVTSLNQGSLEPMVLQSSVSITFKNQSFKHDITLPDTCLDSQAAENICCIADNIPSADHLTEKKCLTDGELCTTDNEKEDRYTNHDRKGIDKPCTFPSEQPDRDNMVYMAVDPDVNYKGPSLPSQNEKKPDMASGSSFSVDSGPSGSSDGAGCAKSDEGQVEKPQSPANSRALNLDLSLRTGSETTEEIDLNLDLVLGFPQIDKYQHENYTKDSGSKDGSNLLVLSLGLPC